MATGQSSDASCAFCRHFLAEAGALEEALPGLVAMSSAYSAARADTGLCRFHGTFRRPADCCRDYEGNVPAQADEFSASCFETRVRARTPDGSDR